MKPPTVQYARSPEELIAFQVVGDGPIDLVLLPPGGWNLDLMWDQPLLERYFRRLESFSRLILLNPRGTGLSDPIPLGSPPTIEEWVMDYRWVLDAVGSERAAFLAVQDLGLAILPFAAMVPERITALALVNCHATLVRKDGYPWGFHEETLDRVNEDMVSAWGTGAVLRVIAPELAADDRVLEWYARAERGTGSPAMFQVIRRTLSSLDVRGVLSSIKAPTLVISHTDDRYIRLGHGRYLAQHIPGARYVERIGTFGLFWHDDVDWILEEVETFLTGTRGIPELDDRVLATILFTDIVGSTARTASVGDRRWGELLYEHDALVNREIERFRGRSVKSTGDGVLATFDGPARAIKCAMSIRDLLHPMGIEIRTGLHTGEIEVRGEDVGGIAVSIGARA